MNYKISDKVVFNGKETTIVSKVKEYPSKKIFYKLESGEKVTGDDLTTVVLITEKIQKDDWDNETLDIPEESTKSIKKKKSK